MLDRLEAMALFVRVVERRSFTAAAADLEVARSTATDVIRRLEARLGTRLLDRTTRHVEPTPEGQEYYQRCLSILAEVEEAEGALRGAGPTGALRVDAPGVLTRNLLLPRLPEFTARYPGIFLQLGQGERLVNLVREGVDCVIRAGAAEDSSLVMRKLPDLQEITCASPAYLAEHGVPKGIEDLAGHRAVGFLSTRTDAVLPLEFLVAGEVREVKLPSAMVANDAETVSELALLGYGLVQAPRYRFRADLAAGRLVEVLPDCPPPPLPLALYYPQNRHLSARVRVFADWVVEVLRSADL